MRLCRDGATLSSVVASHRRSIFNGRYVLPFILGRQGHLNQFHGIHRMRERYKKSLQASAIACLFFYPEFATPQSVTGIAFVEAPEQSSGWCTGSNAGDAIACAREKCVAGGVAAEHCKVMQYCYPSLWAADLFQQHKQGLHWHRYLCGW